MTPETALPLFRGRTLFLGLLFGAIQCNAKLTFAPNALSLTGDISAVQLSGAIRITNSGTSAVNILDIKGDCKCTAVKLSDRVFQPKERGQFTVVVDARGLAGGIEHRVIVTTDEGGRRIYIIPVMCYCKVSAILDRRYIHWKKSDRIGPEVVTVRSAGFGSIQVVGAVALPIGSIATSIIEDDKSAYKITIVPKLSARPFRGEVQIEVRANGGVPKPYRIFLEAD